MTSLVFFETKSRLAFLQNCSDYIHDFVCICTKYAFFCTLNTLICKDWNIPTGTYMLHFSNKTIEKMR